MPSFGESQIAAFSDDIRDGIKGNVFNAKGTGFINGGKGFEETIKFGIVASTKNDQIDYTKVVNKTAPWANEPYQTITYVSAHDNYTLWDKLQTSNPEASQLELLQMNKMSAAIVYTSQGIPFMQAGEEFARTKEKADGTLDENSYKSPDSVNSLDWSRKVEYSNLYNYYKGLISLRSSHKSFRMNTTADIQASLKFLDVPENVVAYTLDGSKVNDSWKNIAVAFNADTTSKTIKLPSNGWVLVVDGNTSGVKKISDVSGSEVTIPAKTSYVLVDKESYYTENPAEKPSLEPSTGTPGSSDSIPEGKDEEEQNKPEDNNPTDTPNDGESPTGDMTNILVLMSLMTLASIAVIYNRKKVIR